MLWPFKGYLMQYEDMTHASTLKLTDRLMRLVRQLMRHKFGEFFFRVVVFEYLEDSGEESTTVASLAVLLDKNPYNLLDVDSVFSGCADRGSLGVSWTRPFTSNDFVINGIDFIL